MKKIALINGFVYQDGKLERLNLLIEGERISALSTSSFEADQTIDCTGKWVLPGAIDPHVHFRTPGNEHKEDWITGSKAAVSAGVTSVMDMPNTNPPTTTLERLNEKRAIAQRDSYVNYAFHFGASPKNFEELHKVSNIPSIKVYFGSTTGNLLVNEDHIITKLLKYSNIPISFHAEDDNVMLENLKKIKEEGITKGYIHGRIRDVNVAYSAVDKILHLAENFECTVYMCHVSSKMEIERILDSKAKVNVFIESAPHHLFLDESLFEKRGNFIKVNPPIRRKEDREFLYQCLKEGKIDTIGTDHAPHTVEEKSQDYNKAPAGLPGVEHSFPLMLNECINKSITIEQLVHLTSVNTAKIFSIQNKAWIKEGFDADIVIVDPEKEWRIEEDRVYTKAGWTPFDGMRGKGLVEKTIVMGNLVYDNGLFSKGKVKELQFSNIKVVKD